jgi:hypothetical protein
MFGEQMIRHNKKYKRAMYITQKKEESEREENIHRVVIHLFVLFHPMMMDRFD